MEHLKGEKPNGGDVIGIYPLLADDTCNFIVFDFDDHNFVGDEWLEEVDSLREICKINSIDILTERSRSGNGAHIWIFFEKTVSAALARKFGFALLDKGSESVSFKNFKYYVLKRKIMVG